MNQLRAFLAKSAPFEGLPGPELDRLVGIVPEGKNAKGDTVFSEGTDADSVWLLMSGRMEIFKYTSEGRPHAIEMINPGELYGTLCRLGGAGRPYPCTAIAAIDSVSVRMADSVFLDLFKRHPSVVSGV